MDLAKWDPGRRLSNLREDMNTLFDRLFEGRGLSAIFERGWAPAVDVAEDENQFVISAELPGLEAGDVEVSITGDTVTIKGEKKRETEEKGKNFQRVERAFGAFSRAIQLPAEVKGEKVAASFKNGVLSVVLPKAEGERKRKIEVKVES